MSVKQAIRESLALLDSRDRRLLLVAILTQVATSALDLLGVLLLGLVGALAVTTIQSQPAPPVVESLAGLLGLEGLSDQALVTVLAASAAIVLLGKSVVSSFLTRRVFVFLANRQALISARLVRDLLARPLTFLQSRSSQETAYALIQGAGAATISILGQSVIVVTELSVLIVLAGALLLIDPLVTLGAIGFFAVVALLLQRLMGSWASRLGRTGAIADIESLNTIQDALATYRELSVLGRRDWYVNRFQELRWTSAGVTADRIFLLQVPKYVFEAALVLGGVVLAGVLFVSKDSVTAVGTLALFLAAASRVMPSLLRLQGASLTLRDNAAAATLTFELAHELAEDVDPQRRQDLQPRWNSPTSTGIRPKEFSAPVAVVVDHVSFTYPGSSKRALADVTLTIPAGNSLAIVGRSGAGKSTLVDVILGVLSPDSGSVMLGQTSPIDLAEEVPGYFGYVPQDVRLIQGTIRENVALALHPDAVDDGDVWAALRRAHIDELVASAPLGLDTPLGEGGLQLSGGQAQRIGIARAFLSNPSILVMDEATSALDAETEHAITRVLRDLHDRVTLVIVAHRLSTIREADVVAYMANGRLVDSGPFADLRGRVPSLEEQATLMGL